MLNRFNSPMVRPRIGLRHECHPPVKGLPVALGNSARGSRGIDQTVDSWLWGSRFEADSL